MKNIPKKYLPMLLFVSLAFTAVAEYRMWVGKNGSKVEAEVVSQNKVTVKLKKKDGSVVSVPISKLSKDDQNYLAEGASLSNHSDSQYYAMKIVLSGDCKKTSFKILPPWDSNIHIFEKICENNIKARKKNLPPVATLSEWGFVQTKLEEYETVGGEIVKVDLPTVVVEYILYLPSKPESDFRFSIEDESKKTTLKVYGYNPETRKSQKIELFKNQTDSEFSIGLKEIKSKCSLTEYTPKK